MPDKGLSLDAFAPNSVILVLPMKHPPAANKLFATGALTVGSAGFESEPKQLFVPATSMLSFTEKGIPET